MRDIDQLAKIVPTYSSGCFCEKPVLQSFKHIPFWPRFEFMKAARQCAKLNNLTIIMQGTGKAREKVALATLAVSCRHHTTQTVRLDWQLQ